MDKLTKANVLYVFNPDKFYKCRDCCFFIPKANNCTYFRHSEWDVDPDASCNRWTTNENGYISGPGTETKENSGYAYNKQGYSCGRCEYFGADAKRCKKVDEKGGPAPGRIDPRGCCNIWEKDAIRGKLTEAALRSMKNMR